MRSTSATPASNVAGAPRYDPDLVETRLDYFFNLYPYYGYPYPASFGLSPFMVVSPDYKSAKSAPKATYRRGGGAMAGRTVYVATYPPRPLRNCHFHAKPGGLGRRPRDSGTSCARDPDVYPSEVRHRIRRDSLADYLEVARKLNRSSVGVVSVQHEYGIWGGDDGEFVLDFVGALTKPVVATLHTVPQSPSARQRAILVGLVGASAASVVMSQSATRAVDSCIWHRPRDRLDVVPHGVPSLPLVAPDTIKPGLGLAPGPVILSFGLLGPGKGYETVIEAMPSVIEVDHAARYVVLGATHPEFATSRGAKLTEPSSCVSPTRSASPPTCCS